MNGREIETLVGKLDKDVAVLTVRLDGIERAVSSGLGEVQQGQATILERLARVNERLDGIQADPGASPAGRALGDDIGTLRGELVAFKSEVRPILSEAQLNSRIGRWAAGVATAALLIGLSSLATLILRLTEVVP